MINIIGKSVIISAAGRIFFEGILTEEIRLHLIYSYPALNLRVQVKDNE